MSDFLRPGQNASNKSQKATATGAAQRDAMFAAANIQNELTGSRLRQRRVSHYVRHQQSDKQFIHLSLSSHLITVGF